MACKCWQMLQSGLLLRTLKSPRRIITLNRPPAPSSPPTPTTYPPTNLSPCPHPPSPVCKLRRRPPSHHALRLSNAQYCESQMTLKSSRYNRLRLQSFPNPPSAPLICRPILQPSDGLSKVINVEVSLPGFRPLALTAHPGRSWLPEPPGYHGNRGYTWSLFNKRARAGD